MLRLPAFFRRELTEEARKEREERLERVVTQRLRDLSDLLRTVADRLESTRQARTGHGRTEEFLQRVKKER